LTDGPLSPWKTIINRYGMEVVEATIRRLQEKGLLRRKCVASEFISPKLAARISSDTLVDYCLWVMTVRLEQEYPAYAKQEKALQVYNKAIEKVPLLQLHINYHALVWIKKPGTKYDHWGSFFLLAVTKHMREKTRRPHHREAIQLLKALRKERVANVYSATKSCIERIKRFTDYYPPSRSDGYSWCDGLALLKKLMVLCKSKTNPLLPSIVSRYRNPNVYKRECDQWLVAATKR
jgi:hypothetical protein